MSDPTLYRFGRLPNDASRPRVRLEAHPHATLNPPVAVDYYSAVPLASWGMLLNDQLGDCVCAGAGHLVDQVVFYGQNHTPAPVTEAEVLAMYEVVGGYVPGNPNTDQGATLQGGLEFLQKTGLAGYKVSGFAQVDAKNVALIKTCIDYFGSIYCGLEVPASAMDQFNAGQPWTVVRRSPIEGGHCVLAVGYDQNYIYVSTWGAIQAVAWSFYTTYFDETWVGIVPQWLESNGKTPSGLDAAGANAQFQALTGSSEAPFPVAPAPTPTPVPDPTPTPTPSPAPADVTALLTGVAAGLSTALGAINAYLGATPPAS